MDLKKKLSQLRKEKGLTQLELAEALQVSRQAVSRWEVGTAVPALDNLVSLSEVYGVPLDYFVHGHMEQPPEMPEKPANPHGLIKRAALALCLIAAGALIATAAWKFHEKYQVRQALERTVVVEIDGIRIMTDNPEQFQHDPDEPRSYRMNPDGTCEEYSLADAFSSMLDRIK